MPPEYDLEILFAICGKTQELITIPSRVLNSANEDFDLKDKTEILDFIATGGLEGLNHINTRPLEKNSFGVEVSVDAYSFYTGDKYGYFAFYLTPNSDWVIKSLKRNTDPDPRNFGLGGLSYLRSQ